MKTRKLRGSNEHFSYSLEETHEDFDEIGLEINNETDMKSENSKN